ncbi:DUF4134 family protein, partial [Acinetobacter baumannii]
MKKVFVRRNVIYSTFCFLLLLLTVSAIAQDGNAGINEANTKVRSYFAAGVNL